MRGPRVVFERALWAWPRVTGAPVFGGKNDRSQLFFFLHPFFFKTQ